MAEVPRFEEDKFFSKIIGPSVEQGHQVNEFYAYYKVEGTTPDWASDDMSWYEENGGEPDDWTRWVFELQLYEWDEDEDIHENILLTCNGSFDKHIEMGVDDGSYNTECDFNPRMMSKLKEFYLSDYFSDFQRFVNGINREVTNRLNILLREEFPPVIEVTSNLINWNQHPPQV